MKTPTYLIGASFRHSGMAVCSVLVDGGLYRLLSYQSDESISMKTFDSWLSECLEDIQFATIYSELPDLILSRLRCVKPKLRVQLKKPLIELNHPTCIGLLDSVINEGRIEAHLADLDQLKDDLSDLEPNNKGELILSPGLEALALSIGQLEFKRVSEAVGRVFPFVPTVVV